MKRVALIAEIFRRVVKKDPEDGQQWVECEFIVCVGSKLGAL